jgi:hypothetical protein
MHRLLREYRKLVIVDQHAIRCPSDTLLADYADKRVSPHSSMVRRKPSRSETSRAQLSSSRPSVMSGRRTFDPRGNEALQGSCSRYAITASSGPQSQDIDAWSDRTQGGRANTTDYDTPGNFSDGF